VLFGQEILNKHRENVNNLIKISKTFQSSYQTTSQDLDEKGLTSKLGQGVISILERK
jgi:DNA-binding protein YbaB